jgi:mannobiose 2-epimerase
MLRLRFLLLVIAALFAGCSSSQRNAPKPQSDRTGVFPPADEEQREKLRQRLDALAKNDWSFWKEHGRDHEHGGFHGTLDREGKPIAPTDKGLIQQARHLWTTSLWYEKKQQAPEVKALSDDLHRFLMAHFYDAPAKEFRFKVSRTGEPVDQKKVLYANAFAIYALVQYARVYGVKEAGETALACLRAFDASAHDAKCGGYFRQNDPPWLTPGAAKETNTHLHLMEAFSSLYAYGKDPMVKERLEELVTLFITKIIQKEGYARKDFSLDWTPFGEPAVSYGHDLETSWLLVEAAESLGRPTDPAITKAALTLGATSAEWGFDAQKGGYFEEGPPASAPTKREKIWWIQAEALPGLYQLYLLSKDTKYIDRLQRTLEFIESHQADRQFGGWYWGISEDGKIGPRGDGKGEEWKAAYHDLRATVFTAEWIAKRKQ